MPTLGKDGVTFDLARFDPKNLLAGLDPVIQTQAVEHARRCAVEHGIVLRMVQGLRTPAQQDLLYAQGRSAPGAVVTAARGGYSWHNFGRAYDVAILTYPGDQSDQDVWDGPWDLVGEIGEQCALEWGGNWKHPDRPHFENRGGLTLATARARYGMGDTLA